MILYKNVKCFNFMIILLIVYNLDKVSMNSVAVFAIGLVTLYFGAMLLGLHKVNEGSVGLYKTLGVL